MKIKSFNQMRLVSMAVLCLSLSACTSVGLSTLKMHSMESVRRDRAVDSQPPRSIESHASELSNSATSATDPPAFARLGPVEPVRRRVSPVSFHPAEARRGVVRIGNVNQSVCEIITPCDSVYDYPDEFLFDGGDRNHPVHYDGNFRNGLDTEDTVGEYRDHLGRHHLRVSNRVAIYAPQFSAVRTVSGMEEKLHVNRAAGAHRTQGEFKMAQLAGPGLHTDSDQAGGLRMRSRPSGLNQDNRDTHVSRVFRRSEHVMLQNAFEDRAFSQRAQFDRTNSAWLAAGLGAAAAWSSDSRVSISASTSAAIEVRAEIKLQEMVGIDDGKRPGTLRIMKIADREVAVGGDEITFTIRYDNLGDHDLSNIVILDNLTPRLEFIDDSDASNRPGELVIEENGRGSHILKFVIDDPLPGHEGGVLQFKARVR
jgi:uncharacterized repeat protein (TIGR01451 family)